MNLLFIYFRNITDDDQRAYILKAIVLIPEEQRAGVIELAAPYLKDITNGYQRADILRAIKKIPEEQRAGVI